MVIWVPVFPLWHFWTLHAPHLVFSSFVLWHISPPGKTLQGFFIVSHSHWTILNTAICRTRKYRCLSPWLTGFDALPLKYQNAKGVYWLYASGYNISPLQTLEKPPFLCFFAILSDQWQKKPKMVAVAKSIWKKSSSALLSALLLVDEFVFHSISVWLFQFSRNILDIAIVLTGLQNIL